MTVTEWMAWLHPFMFGVMAGLIAFNLGLGWLNLRLARRWIRLIALYREITVQALLLSLTSRRFLLPPGYRIETRVSRRDSEEC